MEEDYLRHYIRTVLTSAFKIFKALLFVFGEHALLGAARGHFSFNTNLFDLIFQKVLKGIGRGGVLVGSDTSLLLFVLLFLLADALGWWSSILERFGGTFSSLMGSGRCIWFGLGGALVILVAAGFRMGAWIARRGSLGVTKVLRILLATMG